MKHDHSHWKKNTGFCHRFDDKYKDIQNYVEPLFKRRSIKQYESSSQASVVPLNEYSNNSSQKNSPRKIKLEIKNYIKSRYNSQEIYGAEDAKIHDKSFSSPSKKVHFANSKSPRLAFNKGYANNFVKNTKNSQSKHTKASKENIILSTEAILHSDKTSLRDNVLRCNFERLARKIDKINDIENNKDTKSKLGIYVEKAGYELEHTIQLMKSCTNITLVGELEDACQNNPLLQKLRIRTNGLKEMLHEVKKAPEEEDKLLD